MTKDKNTLLVIDGGTVKSEENGVVTGLGIVFGSPAEPDQSSERDFFTPDSFIMKKNTFEVPLYHNHGFPIKEQIGEARLTKTQEGWRADAQIDLSTELGRSVYESVKTSPYGFSTGALSHLVVREAKENDTNFLRNWVVGELSLTPRPAERKAVVQAVKSIDGEVIYEDGFEKTVKDVTGATNLPLAGRDVSWDAGAAVKRLRDWAGVTDKPNSKYKKAFFWWDESNPDNLTSGKLPFADILDGELTAIPKGIFAVAQRLDGTKIPDADKSSIESKVSSYYKKMAKKFKDDTLVAPWDNTKTHMNEVNVSVYDADGNEVWSAKSENPIPKDAKSIEIKDVSGSVSYSLYITDDDMERGASVSIFEWGGVDNFIGHLQDVLAVAADAVAADVAEDQEDTSTSSALDKLGLAKNLDTRLKKIENIVKNTPPVKAEDNTVSELEAQLKSAKDELAQAEQKSSDSEAKLAEANEQIARLEILAGASKTIDKIKGK